MPIEQLTKKHNLKLGDMVSRCSGGGELLGPILSFETVPGSRSRGVRLVVVVESGRFFAGDVCWVPTLEQIETGKAKARARHFEKMLRM